MADLGLVQHHEFSMSYLCTHGGGLRRELESGESTVNAFFPKLINKLGVILWFNGFLRIMRWQTKSLRKSSGCFRLLGSIMHESVSCTDALCKMYYRSLAFLRNSVNLRLQSVNEGCREKVETIMATFWKASLSRQLFHDQNPAPLGMLHNLSHTSLWVFSAAPRNQAKHPFC